MPATPTMIARSKVPSALHISPKTLQRLEAQGVARFTSQKCPKTGHYASYCTEADFQILEEAVAATRSDRRLFPDGWYLSRDRSLAEFRSVRPTLTARQLTYWKTSCPHLPNGRPLRTQYSGRGQAAWHHEQDIQTIKQSLTLLRHGYYGSPEDPQITARTAQKLFGFDPKTLRKWELFCPHLPTQRLTPILELRKTGGSAGREIRTYRVSDLHTIKQAIITRSTRFDGIYPDGPDCRFTLRRAEEESGLSQSFLYGAIKDGRLPAELKALPGIRGFCSPKWTVLKSDLRNFQDQLTNAKRTPKPTGWMMVTELVKSLGIVSITERAFLHSYVRELRETAILKEGIDWRRHYTPFRGGQPPYLYNPKTVVPLLKAQMEDAPNRHAAPATPIQPTPAPQVRLQAARPASKKRFRDAAREIIQQMPTASAKELRAAYRKKNGRPIANGKLPDLSEKQFRQIRSEMKAAGNI